jgi:hypothetical protein
VSPPHPSEGFSLASSLLYRVELINYTGITNPVGET